MQPTWVIAVYNMDKHIGYACHQGWIDKTISSYVIRIGRLKLCKKRASLWINTYYPDVLNYSASPMKIYTIEV